jgi:succinate dehydrogenase / fumarate reductase, cytochrome b subunit
MQWTNFYTSSIGQKFLMAITGIFLMVFLVIHLGLNAMILITDQGVLFNHIAKTFRHNWGLHLLEILVFCGFILHIYQGLSLTWQNKSKRTITYVVKPSFSLDPARSMGVLGTVILGFLLLHLYQFWLPNIIGTSAQSDDLYRLLQKTMSQGWVVVIYVLGCLAVAAHIWHGWGSAAITLGLSDRYQKLLSFIGMSMAIAVPLGLATIPIALFISFHAQF